MKKLTSLILIFSVLLTGCNLIPPLEKQSEEPSETIIEATASPTPSEEVKESPKASAEHENALNISMRAPVTLNPLMNKDITVDNVLKLIFEPVFSLDESQRPVPNLAEKISFSENGLEATVTLKNNIYWSDGEIFDGNDLIFSVNTLKNADKSVIYKDTVKDILSCELIDSFNVKINLSKPSGGFGYMLLFPAIPEHYYKNKLDNSSVESLNPIGNGLYKFVSYENVKNMQLTASNTTFRQKPLIQKINVLITSDIQTDYYSFEQNILDFISADILNFGKYSPSQKTGLTEYSTSNYDFIGFNFKNLALEDKKMRQAITKLIDVDYIIESVYLGHAYRTYSVISPDSWAYEKDVEKYEYNKQEAKDLISQAGYKDNNADGIMDREIAGVYFDLSFRILVNEENEERVEIANLVSSSLNEAGIATDIIVCDYNTYLEKLRNKEYDIFIGGFNFSLKPDFAFAFHSSQIDVGSNFFSYRSEILDTYLIAAQNAQNEAQYKDALSKIQKHIASELPCISLAFRKKVILYNENIKGGKKPSINNIFSNINEWYVQ
ncbi:peptide ABC transporter substrate-binding protein [Anaeropeptidivorans aminofermentans]|uniref:peptide ABC transporter substrate-binding protein n=1 Tax=Anaeropeptidivorans aminofermentans TaxID=2934315 RepID=UPI002024FFA1|nr:peptide ABC transporter substrate-binding protein [Anaeropeptidivorans aminofermentans]